MGELYSGGDGLCPYELCTGDDGLCPPYSGASWGRAFLEGVGWVSSFAAGAASRRSCTGCSFLGWCLWWRGPLVGPVWPSALWADGGRGATLLFN